MATIIVDTVIVVVSIGMLDGCRDMGLEVASLENLLGAVDQTLVIVAAAVVDCIKDLRQMATFTDITYSFEAAASSYLDGVGSTYYIAVGT